MRIEQSAPGWPGIEPRWTSSAKSGLGASVNSVSRLWFTLSHGILNEVYYPRVDQACMRDCQLLVADGHDYFAEEKRETRHKTRLYREGVPAFHVVNSSLNERFEIYKDVVADPRRPALLQQIRFRPSEANPWPLQLYVLLAPHLGNQGYGNTAWVSDYKGVPMLFASRDGLALAMACSVPWLAGSAGFVGVSDGWQLLNHYKQLPCCYRKAQNGNVALTGQICTEAASTQAGVTLAIGFGDNPFEAAQRARASLQVGFTSAWEAYVEGWERWHKKLTVIGGKRQSRFRVSAAVLKTHESKRFPGGIIASLSIPWGMSKSDNDLGGYHLVWPRDLVETAGGLLAAGANDDAVRVLDFLRSTQEDDGHWNQNMWLDGQAYWHGVQMDETALPILLVDLIRRELGWQDQRALQYWPMVRAAAAFVVKNGPVTQQDRWEEDPGYSPFTLATEIAGLLAAADLADLAGEGSVSQYLRETADAWFNSLDRWIYASDTDLAREVGVAGYYVRDGAADYSDCGSPLDGFVAIKNRPLDESSQRVVDIVSPDALALVRFGLRQATDPRMVDTVKVIDAVLKVELPEGPGWRRYNHDGYGEHTDGSPFDGAGVGRVWPLLNGERAHYELAAGNKAAAKRLLKTYENFAGEEGLLPEQTWDSADIPERELFFGRPAGSAMPLVWAHAEHLKTLRSLRDGRIFDLPPQTVARYLDQTPPPAVALWRFNHKCRQVARGATLRIETLAPARLRWTTNNWQTFTDTPSRDSGLGMHVVDLSTKKAAEGGALEFTFYWPGAEKWEGVNFRVKRLPCD